MTRYKNVTNVMTSQSVSFCLSLFLSVLLSVCPSVCLSICDHSVCRCTKTPYCFYVFSLSVVFLYLSLSFCNLQHLNFYDNNHKKDKHTPPPLKKKKNPSKSQLSTVNQINKYQYFYIQQSKNFTIYAYFCTVHSNKFRQPMFCAKQQRQSDWRSFGGVITTVNTDAVFIKTN